MHHAVACSQLPLSRMAIDDIPLDQRKYICTNIDYSIHEGNGHWDMIVSELGFTETDSKNFLLAFPKGQSPTENLLRECSYRNYRVSYILHVLKKVGMVSLTEKVSEEIEEKYRAGVHRVGQITDMSLQKSSGSDQSITDVDKIGGLDTIQYSYKEIERGTEYFAEKMKLGAGAFGKVYKVKLKNTTFACKVLTINKSSPHFTFISKHTEHRDLRNELQYLAEYRHPNIIPLYGWSLDGEDPCLIYQYMKNGSLQDCLQKAGSGKEPLNWVQRIRIACDAATGLQFLHTIKEKPLIHGDIKTANILLDEAFGAKLGDFGLAREGPRTLVTGSYIQLNDEHTPGTVGYLAPEYLRSKTLSVKVDTYAFGVVLLELYTGRMAYSRNSRHDRAVWLRDFMADIASDPSGEPGSEESLYRTQTQEIPSLPRNLGLRFVHLALECSHEKRNKRPSMPGALKLLESLCTDIEDVMSNSDKDGTNSGSSSGSLGLPSTHSRANWISGSHQLSRTPVESIDTSSILSENNIRENVGNWQQNTQELSTDMEHLNLNNFNPFRPNMPHASMQEMNGNPYPQNPNMMNNPPRLHPMVSMSPMGLLPMGLVPPQSIPWNLQHNAHQVRSIPQNMPMHHPLQMSFYQPTQYNAHNAAQYQYSNSFANMNDSPNIANPGHASDLKSDHRTATPMQDAPYNFSLPDSMSSTEYEGTPQVCSVSTTPSASTNQLYPFYTAAASQPPSTYYTYDCIPSITKTSASEPSDSLKVNSVKAQLMKNLKEVDDDTDVTAILDKMENSNEDT